MDITQIIGFFITMAAIAVLAGKRIRDEQKKRSDPRGFAREKSSQEERLKSFLKSLDIEMEEPIPPPPPKKPLPPAIRRIKAEVEKVQPAAPKPEHKLHYPGALIAERSQARKMIDALPSKKQLVIFTEIISKPKWNE